jgi:Tfp pilus assembly protein PilO
MSQTQEWIKQQFVKERNPAVTIYSLQQQVEETSKRIKTLEEDIAWRQNNDEVRP